MTWLTRNHHQTATLWSKSGTDVYGNASFSSPTQIKCRWEEGTRQSIDADGNEITSQATVYLGQDVGVGDYLYLGTSAASTPPTGAYVVRNFFKMPSVKADKFERKAVL